MSTILAASKLTQGQGTETNSQTDRLCAKQALRQTELTAELVFVCMVCQSRTADVKSERKL